MGLKVYSTLYTKHVLGEKKLDPGGPKQEDKKQVINECFKCELQKT